MAQEWKVRNEYNERGGKWKRESKRNAQRMAMKMEKMLLQKWHRTVCLHMWKSLSRSENHSGIPIDRISLLSWCVILSNILFAYGIFKRKQSHKPFNFIKYNTENVRMIVTSVSNLHSHLLIYPVEWGRMNRNLFPERDRAREKKNIDCLTRIQVLLNEREKETQKSIGSCDASSEREQDRECQFTFHNGTIAKSVKVSEFIHNKFIITFDSLRCTTQSILIVFESY